MKMQRAGRCDDSRLELLLFGDGDSDAFRAAAEHVETCDACQRRLTELAGDADSWSEVRQLLGDADTEPLLQPESRSGSGMTDGEHANPIDSGWRKALDFLAPPSHPELLGRLGRYEIERLIGSGGMGLVLKGFDTELNRPVAIKVLAPHLAHNGAARQRFAREGRAAAAVVHEHVVAIHNVETEGEVPFLVMQYVAGESLQTRVDRQGPLGVSEMLRIAIQAASGLAAAHQQGLVHRDIKPANLLLESGIERALLTDFGLARAIDDASLTHTGVVAGTPHYMSPEQAEGRTVDHRSDLFSLGAVLYFMATGHPPFRAERPMAVLHRICRDRHRAVREVNPEIPEPLSAIIDRLLEKRPQRRPATAAEVQQTLAGLLSDIQQGRIRHRRAGRLRSRVGMLVGLVAATVLVAATSWTIAWLVRPETTTPTVRVGPAPPIRVDESYASDLSPPLLSFGPAAETEFAAEVAGIASELERLESQRQPVDLFVQEAGNSWYVAAESARRELTQLENTPYPDLASQGDNP